jgi:hypothetical protein
MPNARSSFTSSANWRRLSVCSPATATTRGEQNKGGLSQNADHGNEGGRSGARTRAAANYGRNGKPKHLFMSIERLEPCPEIYEADRVKHAVQLDIDYGKPVNIAYHTSHVVSDTGRMTLAGGYHEGYRHAMIGLLHDKGASFEIEPIVVGAPWLDHPRNQEGAAAIWFGRDYGEILPEDIAEFARMKEAVVASADEWMGVMENIPEVYVKKSIASLLKEPAKSDWSGEENDHFSANVTVADKRCTAAFLLKGPAKFQEMTPAMCGKNGDQIYRLTKTGSDISIVQHAHLIGPAVRETLRSMVVTPGRPAKILCDGRSGNISALESLRIAARPDGRRNGLIIFETVLHSPRGNSLRRTVTRRATKAEHARLC